MIVHLYNTLSGKKEKFIPVKKGQVSFYVCGPTVYDFIHIGNARPFIVFDVLRRFFEFLGYGVNYVLNLTDIDDKIIDRAAQEKVATEEITETFSEAFFEDLTSLGIRKATVYPRATEHVDEIIRLIQALIDNKTAYVSGGDVFFSVNTFDAYGALSGKKTDELRSGARVAVDERKQNPLDFALWKSKKPGEPAWKSPWGEGRPGWHIECSAMSMKYLGETFDIHAGGSDLVFPHHENEIAQSECATGKQFARYWLHNGFLKIDGTKMSKSLGNFRTVREILKHYPGPVLRMFFLQKHYRNPIDLTEEGLSAAQSATERMNHFYQSLIEKVSNCQTDGTAAQVENPNLAGFQKMKDDFVTALADDFNTPAALSVFFEIVREANKIISKQVIDEKDAGMLHYVKEMVDSFNGIMGVIADKETEVHSDLTNDLMKLILEVRHELRKKKEWALSDKIRDYLSDKGIVLEDKGDETMWRVK